MEDKSDSEKSSDSENKKENNLDMAKMVKKNRKTYYFFKKGKLG